jgi:hypothetical protein
VLFPENGLRGSRVRLLLDVLVGVKFVGARPKVLGGRPMLGGAAAFVFGRELFPFGAGGSLLRSRGVSVGFALSGGCVASGLRGLLAALFGLGFGAASRPEHDASRDQEDDANDD